MATEVTAVAANEYIPTDADFVLKKNGADIEVDTNFASQSFWKEVIARFIRKRSARLQQKVSPEGLPPIAA